MSAFTSYAYRAVRGDGAMELGVGEAASRESASAALADRGLFPIEVRVEVPSERRGTRVPPDELALGLHLLAGLLEAGLPMARALSAFAELAPRSWTPATPALQQAVREGQSLAAALAAPPLALPGVVTGIIRAGEAGSGLAGAVRRAADVTQAAAATRRAIRGALAYPILLASTSSGALVLLVGVVLPKFAAILDDLGQSLPASTRLVLAAAALLRAAALPAAVGAMLVLVAWRAWVAHPAARARWHGWLLVLPGVGPARRAAATANAAAALAALLESGVPHGAALAHAARAAGDAAIEARLLAARETMTRGERLSRALAEHDAATPTLVQLVRAGEETGRLASMLAHGAALERERAERLVKTAVRLLEPALILGFGAAVALVAAALLQAVYGVRPM